MVMKILCQMGFIFFMIRALTNALSKDSEI